MNLPDFIRNPYNALYFLGLLTGMLIMWSVMRQPMNNDTATQLRKNNEWLHQRDSLRQQLDSLRNLVLKSEQASHDLALVRDTIYLSIDRDEKDYQKLSAISDTTDFHSDLRFLSTD